MKHRRCPLCKGIIPARPHGQKRFGDVPRPRKDARLVVPYRKNYLERFADRDGEEPKKPIRLP